jgi:anthranilate 1,2-dioxygenase small subunit
MEESLTHAIRELEYAYVQCIDDDRLEEWPSFFVQENPRYEIISRENWEQNLPVAVMLCESQGMLQDRVVALRQANIYAKHYYRHLISNIRIVESEPAQGLWRVQANYVVFQSLLDGEVQIFQVGRYLDEVRYEGNALKFQSKRAIFDNARVKTLLVTPI